MSVWLCIPSKRSPEQANPVLKQWRERGYSIHLWVDSHADGEAKIRDCYNLNYNEYPGYARAVNRLIWGVMHVFESAQWFVTGGDDILPDPNHSAEEIEKQCSEHFAEMHAAPDCAPGVALSVRSINAALNGLRIRTFGVMQPTGDRWGDKDGAYIDRVAGSPWIGREFARRMYKGNGPYWPEYTHMGVDEELQAVAMKYGVFWQRPDLTHYHQHWGRPLSFPCPICQGKGKVFMGAVPMAMDCGRCHGKGFVSELMGDRSRMPAFLEHANSGPEWERYKRIFNERKAAGFPGSEPL